MATRRRGGGNRGVRITGGELRGRHLPVPKDTRPTEGRVREALFSIWADRVQGCHFLDLFAGSGVVGLEAASRGALTVLALEKPPRAGGLLEANVRRVGEGGRVDVRRGLLPAALTALAELPMRFDLVFADPPYRWPDDAELLAAIEPLLAVDGELAVEHSTRHEPPTAAGGLVRTGARRYGESSLAFYRRGSL